MNDRCRIHDFQRQLALFLTTTTPLTVRSWHITGRQSCQRTKLLLNLWSPPGHCTRMNCPIN